MLQQNIGQQYAALLTSLAISGSPEIGHGAFFVLLKLLDEVELARGESFATMMAPPFVSARLKQDEHLFQQTVRALYKMVGASASRATTLHAANIVASLRAWCTGWAFCSTS